MFETVLLSTLLSRFAFAKNSKIYLPNISKTLGFEIDLCGTPDEIIWNKLYVRPGRLRGNRGNRGIRGKFAFPLKPNIHVPL